MTRPLAKITLFVLLLLGSFSGCNTAPHTGHGSSPMQSLQVDPQQVQAACMSFAMRYTTSMADIYDRIEADLRDPAARRMALNGKLQAGWGSMSNAVNPNPLVGLMDMALMVTLTRETTSDPWARELFGEANQAGILSALQTHENDIWNLAAVYFSPAQLTELRGLAQRWRRDHSQQRYVSGARLADFPQPRPSADPGQQIANSVLNLVRLDPFAGLDPAVRQVEESRILAERMFFYIQNMPTLISWQTDSLYDRMLADPQMSQFLKNTGDVSGNAAQFTQASAHFAETCSRFADTIESFRKQLPDQQASLVKQLSDAVTTQRDAALIQANADISTLRDTSMKQLNDVVAVQREAALKQASAEISQERDQAVHQLDTAIAAQQTLLAKNVQLLMDSSIDRFYQRTRALILIAASSLLAVLVFYRTISHFLFRAKPTHG